MITRKIKLKLNGHQKRELSRWLWHLTGVYNWAINKTPTPFGTAKTHSLFDLYNLTSGVSKKIKVPSAAIAGVIYDAHNSWQRCFSRQNERPHLKGSRNRLNYITFRNSCKLTEKGLKIPKLGAVNYHRYDLPAAEMAAQVRLIKKASGWYAVLSFKAEHEQVLEITDNSVGIDTGFKDLAILSDGIKFQNPKELEKNLKQLGRFQRGLRRKKAARLHEKIANQRKDRNHKISHAIVRNYKNIFITKDNLKAIQKRFGKSVQSTGISQLRSFLLYKSSSCGRVAKLVGSKFTTMTCSGCQSLTGPTGLGKLNVRNWVCSACGAEHDRDVNAAINVLNSGLRYNLEMLEMKGPTAQKLAWTAN